MKAILPLFLAAVTACAADAPADNSAPPPISKKRHEHRDAGGKVDAYAETFYRGGDRILIQATYTTPQPNGIRMWREFLVGGHTVLKELDYGDTKPQMVWVYRNNALYDAFRRHADGSVEPMTSEELAKAKREMEEFMGAFEGVMERVRERIETNSVEKVLGDLKMEVDRNKQKQRTGGDEK